MGHTLAGAPMVRYTTEHSTIWYVHHVWAWYGHGMVRLCALTGAGMSRAGALTRHHIAQSYRYLKVVVWCDAWQGNSPTTRDIKEKLISAELRGSYRPAREAGRKLWGHAYCSTHLCALPGTRWAPARSCFMRQPPMSAVSTGLVQTRRSSSSLSAPGLAARRGHAPERRSRSSSTDGQLPGYRPDRRRQAPDGADRTQGRSLACGESSSQPCCSLLRTAKRQRPPAPCKRQRSCRHRFGHPSCVTAPLGVCQVHYSAGRARQSSHT